MNRLSINNDSKTVIAMKGLLNDRIRRSHVAPAGNCPVNMCASYARQCLSESCGKCIPCKVGLERVAELLEEVEDGKGTPKHLTDIKDLLESIRDSADCAIGFSAADDLYKATQEAWDDLESHVNKGVCNSVVESIPCKSGCPAHVDIPGYIALTKAGRYADAVRVIRYDNPFPASCALVCEHPCERYCRRNMIDDSVNIRGIKRSAVDGAGKVDPPECMPSTGKRVAIIGGGPSGLTVAYYLQLMGHQTTLFERRKKLGGMMRYGIPRYRLPDEYLAYDIDTILSTGVDVKLGNDITDKEFNEIKHEYDAVYISIGAHAANKLGIEGEDAEGVLSAVELLRAMGDDEAPDFKGKRVAIVGGGNVAMDCTRTAKRLGADVTCVYRRRQEDMTAQPEEVLGAIAETCRFMTMAAPVRIETDSDGKVSALIVQPQIPGEYDRGRPMPVSAERDEVRVECDIVVAAIGQKIDSGAFEAAGVPTNRNRISASDDTKVDTEGLIFSGGDVTSGPSTVIRAIEAGKTAAANIDQALGFNHRLPRDIEIPYANAKIPPKTGRINLPEREALDRAGDFTVIEGRMTDQELHQECDRCLRCDHYGMGSVRGGRESW